MKPKPVQPKRGDFPSFDDYFHAMIQYHLELSRQHLKNVQSFLAIARTPEISLPEERSAWHDRLRSFMEGHVQ